ncbi:MAG: penicillin-binding protein activator LpoB [Candidatus Eisenbacteria bacterium]|nr:penicillin-binding protein activator LpoB [Candidatus Eisenbacteria bacterium]
MHAQWASLAKKTMIAVTSLVVIALLAGCSKKVVSRIDPNETVDLSGRWNDVDSRLVAEEMIADCLGHSWVTDHMTASRGKRPAVIAGAVRNETSEHISVETFLNDIERALVNSGKVRVVASSDEREQLRDERLDQWENASRETVKRLGQELGADYMLYGQVNSITDSEDGKRVVYYQIDLTLADIESNEKVWLGQKKIKKYIARGKYKP